MLSPGFAEQGVILVFLNPTRDPKLLVYAAEQGRHPARAGAQVL